MGKPQPPKAAGRRWGHRGRPQGGQGTQPEDKQDGQGQATVAHLYCLTISDRLSPGDTWWARTREQPSTQQE